MKSDPELGEIVRRLKESANQIRARRDMGHAKNPDLSALSRMKAQFQRGAAQSKEQSRWQFEHASEFNRILRELPDFIPKAFERRLPYMPASLDRIAAERLVIGRVFGVKEHVPNPCWGTLPVIIGADFDWVAGQSRTITGTGFGGGAGTVVLTLDAPNGGISKSPMETRRSASQAARRLRPTTSAH